MSRQNSLNNNDAQDRVDKIDVGNIELEGNNNDHEIESDIENELDDENESDVQIEDCEETNTLTQRFPVQDTKAFSGN